MEQGWKEGWQDGKKDGRKEGRKEGRNEIRKEGMSPRGPSGARWFHGVREAQGQRTQGFHWVVVGGQALGGVALVPRCRPSDFLPSNWLSCALVPVSISFGSECSHHKFKHSLNRHLSHPLDRLGKNRMEKHFPTPLACLIGVFLNPFVKSF